MDIIPLVSVPERPVYLPIHIWEDELIKSLFDQIALEENIDIGTTSAILNNLALLSVLQGSSTTARQFCELHIQLCSKLYTLKQDISYLKCSIQPWINLARLARESCDIEDANSAYTLLSPNNRGVPVKFNQQSYLSLDEIIINSGDNQLQYVLDNVYWLEFGRYLLRRKDFSATKKHCISGLKTDLNPRIKTCLLEMYVIADANINPSSALLSYIEKVLDRVKNEGWALLSFLLLKSQIYKFLEASLDKDHQLKVDEACNKMVDYGSNIENLIKINSVIDVLEKIDMAGYNPELINTQYDMAINLNDEISIFWAMRRKLNYGVGGLMEFDKVFANSRYPTIREFIDAPSVSENLKLNTLLMSIENLSNLDFKKCQKNLEVALQMKYFFR